MATTGPLRIKLRCASWQQLATIYRRDLSKGTMFLRATNPPPVGTPIRVDLTLPSASVIELTGVLAQHVADPQRGNGVELELAPIAADAIWMIESALAAEKPRALPAGSTAAPLPPTAVAPAPSLAEGAEAAAAETELARALLAEAESLKKLNPFLVLGIGYEAGDADVRQAFAELTKRYHPDRFARYESNELRRVAAEIFVLIRDAYRRLGDEAARAQVLASLGRTRDPAAPPRTGSGAWADVRRPAAHIPALPKTVPLRNMVAPRTSSLAAPDVRTGTVPVATPAGSTASAAPTPPAAPAPPDPADLAALEELLDEGRLDEALSGYRMLAKRHPQERSLRAGAELVEGLLALRLRDRLGAAQRFEAALEIDPSNERAACELADMRRQATDERKGLLSRLMGKREGT